MRYMVGLSLTYVWWYKVSEQKIEQKIDKDSKAGIVSSPSNSVLAKEQAAKLKVKGKGKGKKKDVAPKDNSIAGTLSARLDRYEQREKVLAAQIAQREQYLAKLQKNCDKLKEIWAETQKQHAVQVCAIKDLMQRLNGKVS